jgi:hypothetical protein
MPEPARGVSGWWKRTIQPRASGIFQVKTLFLSRSQVVRRPPKLYRPSLTFNLALLLLGVALFAVASVHRRHLDSRFSALVVESEGAPFEVQRIRRDLAALELDEKSLETELEARLGAADAQKASEFYLVLDAKTGKLSFRFGDRVVREAPIRTRAPRRIRTASGDRIAPAPLSGAFTVRQKLLAPAWKPPAWAWQEAGRPVPSPLPEIPGGLGRYVVVLTDDVVLHSPPPPESPLQGPSPGSFEAPEADLAAIWKRIGPETRVYVF